MNACGDPADVNTRPLSLDRFAEHYRFTSRSLCVCNRSIEDYLNLSMSTTSDKDEGIEAGHSRQISKPEPERSRNQELPKRWLYYSPKIGRWTAPYYASPPVQLLLVALTFFLYVLLSAVAQLPLKYQLTQSQAVPVCIMHLAD